MPDILTQIIVLLVAKIPRVLEDKTQIVMRLYDLALLDINFKSEHLHKRINAILDIDVNCCEECLNFCHAINIFFHYGWENLIIKLELTPKLLPYELIDILLKFDKNISNEPTIKKVLANLYKSAYKFTNSINNKPTIEKVLTNLYKRAIELKKIDSILYNVD